MRVSQAFVLSKAPSSARLYMSCLTGFSLIFLLSSASLYAQDVEPIKASLPDEIEAVGGAGMAQGHAGAASLNDEAAIHLNPAMLYLNRSYDVGAGYFWPREGRSFYKLSVIDGVTSRWTAGFEYTAFPEKLEDQKTREWDSPVHKRGSVAFGVPSDHVALGFSAHYVEGENIKSSEAKKLKGFTLGLGLVFNPTEDFRVGLSAENLNNERVKELSPLIYRAGLTWAPTQSTFSVSLDYRQRERSAFIEGVLLNEDRQIAITPEEIDALGVSLEAEKMLLLGAQFTTFDIFRVFLSGGKTLGDKEETKNRLSGGLGIYQKNFSLAYMVSRNYPEERELQSSLHLSIALKL